MSDVRVVVWQKNGVTGTTSGTAYTGTQVAVAAAVGSLVCTLVGYGICSLKNWWNNR